MDSVQDNRHTSHDASCLIFSFWLVRNVTFNWQFRKMWKFRRLCRWHDKTFMIPLMGQIKSLLPSIEGYNQHIPWYTLYHLQLLIGLKLKVMFHSIKCGHVEDFVDDMKNIYDRSNKGLSIATLYRKII